MPDVSFVIPHCGTPGKDAPVGADTAPLEQMLQGCLLSIPGACDDLSYEVIIIDNRPDGVPELKPAVPSKIIRNARLTATLNRSWNQGCSCASGHIIAVINDDVVLGVHSVARVFLAMGVFNMGAMYTEHTTFDLPPDFQQRAQERANRPMCLEGPPEFRGFAFFLSRECYRLVGPFDEQFRFFYGDDDYWMRLILHKQAPRALSNALVHHYGQGTTSKIGVHGGTWHHEIPGRETGCVLEMYGEDGAKIKTSEGEKLAHKWGGVTGQELVRRVYGEQMWGPKCNPD